MGMQKIKFNVDYGLNFTEKNIQKELEKQYEGIEDQLQKAIDNGEKISISIDVDNAVDLSGNPIDQKSLKNFTKKYETAMNSALNKMITEFRNNMSNQISDAVSENLKTEINKLFSDMGQNIVDGIINMKNEIMSSISGNQVVINTADMVKVDTSSTTDSAKQIKNTTDKVVESIDDSSEKIKNANKKAGSQIRTNQDFVNAMNEATADLASAQSEYEKAKKSFESILNEEIVIKENLENDKKKNKNISFTNSLIEDLKISEDKLKETVKQILNIYNKNYEELCRIEELEDDEFTDKIEKKYQQLEINMSQIVDIIQKIGLTKDNIKKIAGDSEGLDEIFRLINSDDFKKEHKSNNELESAKTILDAREKAVQEANKRLTRLQSMEEKMKKNFPDDGEVREEITRSGNTQYKSSITIHPVLNMDKFIKDTINSIESIKETISEHPVEVPITVNPESLGNVSAEIITTIEKDPIKLEIDTEYFKNKLIEAAKEVNLDLSGNISNVNINGSISGSMINSSDIADMFDNSENVELPDGFMDNLMAEMNSLNEVENKVIETSEEIESSQQVLKQSAKEVVTALIGEFEDITTSETEAKKSIEEQIEMLQYLHDMRLKKNVKRSSEEKTLENKKDKTDEENARLKVLKNETKERRTIRNEWLKLTPILKEINVLNSEKEEAERKLTKLNQLRQMQESQYLQPTEIRQLEQLEKEEEICKNILSLYDEKFNKLQQTLSFQKKSNKTYKKYSESALIDFYKIYQDRSITENKAKKKLEERLESTQTGSYDVDYEKNYKKSLDESNRLIERRLKKLEKQKKMYIEIANLVKEKGWDGALVDVENRRTEIAKNLKDNNLSKRQQKELESQRDYLNDMRYQLKYKKDSISDEAYKYGILSEPIELSRRYTFDNEKIEKLKANTSEAIKIVSGLYKKYKENLDALSSASEENVVEIEENLKKISTVMTAIVPDQNKLSSYIKDYTDEDNKYVNAIYQNSTFGSELSYKSELKNVEYRNSELDRLRYEDLHSFEQYLNNYNKLQKARKNKKFYDKQIKEEKDRLITNGVSEDEANNLAINALGKVGKDEYYNSKDTINKLSLQFDQVEQDLEQIFKLMTEIEEIQTKISTSNDLSLKSELYKKRQSLETIIGRTGWGETDLKLYQSIKSQLHNDDESATIIRNIDIDSFKKDADSITQVIENIDNEINKAKQENKALEKEIQELDKVIENSRKKVSKKHETDAEYFRQKFEEAKSEFEEFKKQYDQMDDLDKELNKNEFFKKKGIADSYKKKYEKAVNPASAQVEIDQEVANNTIEQQEEISLRRNQIIANNDYIKSLEKLRAVQEKARKEQEPTKAELKEEKLRKISERDSTNKSLDNAISKSEEKINSIQDKIKEAENTGSIAIEKIKNEIEELNNQLKKSESKLEKLKNREVSVGNESINSSIYEEYLLKQGDINKSLKEYDEAPKQLKELEKKKKEAEDFFKELNDLRAKRDQAYKNRQSFKDSNRLIKLEREKERYAGYIKDYEENFERLKLLISQAPKALQELPTDSNNLKNIYSKQLFNAFEQEQAEYNTELQKTGELTEKAEEHLYNMWRYMKEYNKVSGEFKTKDVDVLSNSKIQDAKLVTTLPSEVMQKFGLSNDDIDNMYDVVFDAISSNKNISDSSQNIDNQIAQQELIIKKIKEKIELNERMLSKDYAAELKKELSIEQQKLETLREEKKSKENLYLQEIQEIDNRINSSDKKKQKKKKQKKSQEKIKESKKVEQSDFTDRDIVLETDAIEQKTEALKEEAIAQKAVNIAETENRNLQKKQSSLQATSQSVEEISQDLKEADNKIEEFQAGTTTATTAIVGDIDKIIDAINRLILSLDRVAGVTPTEVLETYWNDVLSEYSKLQTKTGKFSMAKSVDPTAFNEAMLKYVHAGGSNTFDMLPGGEGKLIDEKSLENVTSKFEDFKAQQHEVQNTVDSTTNAIQQQAVALGQVSIAEGSYVNIAGSVKVDEGQFGSLSGDFTELQNVSYELLEVVKNIYATIANGTSSVIQNIEAVKTPISNITTEAKEVGEAIEEANVKLSGFGNDIKVISGGDIDLQESEFKSIKEAVDAMDEAISSKEILKKIKESGDITAQYVSGTVDGEKQEFVKLTSIFRDTKGEIVKLNHVYDVTTKEMTDASNISVKMANNFELQEKAAKKADAQLTYYTSKLDKLKVKYQMFNIDDFGIDENGNLFAKVGTNAEEIYNIITGKTKELVKNVILEMQKVNDKFDVLKTKSKDGVLSPDQFKQLSGELNLSIEELDNAMNAVNRRINTQLEHTSRNWLNGFQRDLANVQAALYNEDGTIRIDTTGLNSQGLAYLEQYKDAVLDLEDLYIILQNQGENFTQEQITSWKKQMQVITDLKKLLNNNSSKQYINGKGFSADKMSLTTDEFKMLANNSGYAKQKLLEMASVINEVDVEFVKLSSDNRVLTYTFKDQAKNLQTGKISVEDYGKTVRNTLVDSKEHVGLFSRALGTLKDKLIQITKYVSAYEIFYKFVNAIRSGVEIVKELDTAMTEMNKVTHDTKEELKNFAKESHNIAQSIGSTASIIQNSAADWMRLGYAIEEASGLAKNTSILMNVSEFEDIESATESMVAMIQAFKSEGTDVVELSTQLIDKLNNIGNNYSISTSELAESLQRSSGTLIAANNSVDEAIALTTAGNAIIQDAEATGNALKVISMRIRGTSAEALEEEGEDTEGLIETTSKLEEKVKSLTAINGKMGVSLLDANGNYRSTYEILQDIADIWNEIGKADIADGENRQAALLEALAGKTRAQSLASILQNADMLRSAYEDVQNSEGSAAKENEEWMNSIEAHLEVLTAKWQELWDNALVREDINWVIDRLGDIIDFIENIGGLKNAVIAAIGAGISLYPSVKNKSGGRAKLIILEESTLIKYATESFSREVYEALACISM